MRHFSTPSGGLWTASVCRKTHSSYGRQSSIHIAGSVLRFWSSDGVTFDLEDWPANWQEMNDESLIALLRIATTSTYYPDDWMGLSDEVLLGLLKCDAPAHP